MFRVVNIMQSIKVLVGKSIAYLPIPAARVLARTLRLLGLERTARFLATRRQPNGIDSFEIPDSDGVLLVNDGSQVAQLAYFFGAAGYEEHELEIWRALCSGAESIVEIGGNIGYFTIFGANAARHAKYTVFEPHPMSLASLKENVRLNDCRNVQIIGAAAVGDPSQATITLHIPIQETGKQATGAYVDEVEGIDRPSTEAFVVPAYFAGSIKGFDLMKLDVEGAEFGILSALRDTILQVRPILMIEVRRKTPRLRRLIELIMTGSGFEAWAIAAPRLRQVSVNRILDVSLQDEFRTRDLLLIPKERVGLISRYT